MTFNNLALECASNRNSIRKNLTVMVKEGLITEDRVDWTNGKSLIISLTQKGKLEFLKTTFDQFHKCFEDIDYIITNVFENKKLLENYRKHNRQKSPIISVNVWDKVIDVPIDTEDDPMRKKAITDALSNFKDAFTTLMIEVDTYTGSTN